MRHFGPALSVPGVFSPAEEDVTPIEAIQFEFDEDPEVGEALRHYVFSIENGASKQKAEESLNERLFFLLLRARRRADARQSEVVVERL